VLGVGAGQLTLRESTGTFSSVRMFDFVKTAMEVLLLVCGGEEMRGCRYGQIASSR